MKNKAVQFGLESNPKYFSLTDAKEALKDVKLLHKTWHSFRKSFIDDQLATSNNSHGWKYTGYDFMKRVKKWAQYHKDVIITGCDDSYHAGPDIVLIPHRTKYSYMGTTVVVIPQCDDQHPFEFFLYGCHVEDLKKHLMLIDKHHVASDKIEFGRCK